ncbi:helix-turn-helix transcriptional regulator [Roseibium limicola]|uniref:WYL domain-containing protein n=1 Tax=Roseibium limicola TaxID=2816037 RepID=A0A939ENT9_9HYPH|nr:WYL domain-containing protein [Roseibium limicola]MBO0345570.1 WYL domain-containing protein [Roseibium limicola]
MNSIERALAILLLLTGGRLITATTLSERFEVSLRTIYRDIDRLIALGIPVEAERGSEGGYRLAKDYLQPPVALSRNETAALLTALALVRSLRTLPLKADLEAAERKLIASLPKSVLTLLGDAERVIGIEPMPADIFHYSTKAEPTEHWQTALDGFMIGLLESRRVRFEHHNPARPAARPHDVEPYGVLFDRDLWYLAGRSVDTGEFKIYRADRVRQIEVSGFRFRPDPEFHVSSLLGGAWLSEAMRRWEKEGPSTRIRMHKDQIKRLAQDWYYRHATVTADGPEHAVLSLPNVAAVRILPLVRWLGPGAEILEPVELRDQLNAELEELMQAHQSS